MLNNSFDYVLLNQQLDSMLTIVCELSSIIKYRENVLGNIKFDMFTNFVVSITLFVGS